MESFSRIGSKFDIIFCRNVLIYFSPDLKREILLKFHQHLNPGSYLILGASESLNGLSDKYEMIQCRPGIIYRAK
jgi:chemotaxis protein methyltransferase CheR